MQPKAEAAAVAWAWRDRVAPQEGGRAREAANARKRGLIGGAVGLAAAAVLQFLFHKPVAAAVVAIIAASIALLALVSPLGAYKGLTRVLDRFARAVGSGVTWVLMTLLFYLVFLPMGAFLRARGKLRISKGADRRLPSYWTSTEEREPTLDSYRRQF